MAAPTNLVQVAPVPVAPAPTEPLMIVRATTLQPTLAPLQRAPTTTERVALSSALVQAPIPVSPVSLVPKATIAPQPVMAAPPLAAVPSVSTGAVMRLATPLAQEQIASRPVSVAPLERAGPIPMSFVEVLAPPPAPSPAPVPIIPMTFDTLPSLGGGGAPPPAPPPVDVVPLIPNMSFEVPSLGARQGQLADRPAPVLSSREGVAATPVVPTEPLIEVRLPPVVPDFVPGAPPIVTDSGGFLRDMSAGGGQSFSGGGGGGGGGGAAIPTGTGAEEDFLFLPQEPVAVPAREKAKGAAALAGVTAAAIGFGFLARRFFR